jgi:AraC-like DNA-binding protein
MRKEQVYLEPRLTLAELASRLGIPSNYLSQAINQQAGCNFHDYVNRYRIEAAKADLADPAQAERSVLAIAMDAGFHSKSAFYATFKEFVGMTPSEYRRRAGS